MTLEEQETICDKRNERLGANPFAMRIMYGTIRLYPQRRETD